MYYFIFISLFSPFQISMIFFIVLIIIYFVALKKYSMSVILVTKIIRVFEKRHVPIFILKHEVLNHIKNLDNASTKYTQNNL